MVFLFVRTGQRFTGLFHRYKSYGVTAEASAGKSKKVTNKARDGSAVVIYFAALLILSLFC